MKAGDKAAEDAAYAAFRVANEAEQVAGHAAAAAVAAASVVSTAAQDVAQQASQEVASVAAEVSEVAQEAASQVQNVVASTQSIQEAALSALQELEQLPGSTGFHSQEVQAAIEQVKAEMEGRDYSYMGYSSYEEAMKEIKRMEKTGKSVVQCLSNKNGGKGEGC